MKRFGLFFFILLILISCVKFDKIGIPSWETEYQFTILNDSYDVYQVADYDSSLYVQDDILRFHTSLSDSVNFSNVTIQHPEEKNVSILLSNLSEEISQLNGSQTVVPAFDIQPVQKNIPNYDEFQEITFGSAQIKFTISNNTDIYLGNVPDNPLQISLLNKSTGSIVFQFTVEENIPPHSFYTSILDLSNYTFPNSLILQMGGGSIGSNGEVITVDTSQEINIAIELLDFKIKHVIAHIPYQQLSQHYITKYISLTFPYIDGTFAVTSNSSINFKITSPIPAQTSFKLISASFDGIKDTLKIDGNLPVIYSSSGIIDTTFYSDNSNLNDLLTLLPEKFEMIFSPFVGDSSNTIYEIWDNDQVKVMVTIDTNINLEANCWIIPRDDNSPKITATNVEDFDESKFNGFVDGGLKLFFDNHTGEQLGLDLLASNSRENLNDFNKILHPDTSKVTIFSIPVITAGKDSVDFVIKKDDLEVFIPDSVFVVPRIKMISNANSPFAEGIDIIARMHIKILISDDLVSNKD